MSAIVLASTENMDYTEWLDLRKKGIGGSDASVVCGINRYKSPIELFMEKTGQLPHQEAGEAAYWGTRLESLVRAEFTKRTGIEIMPSEQILQSSEYPFMLANLDGVCVHPVHGQCVFEAKTASAYKSGEWVDNIPDEYMLQIQHYMAVTDFAGTYIAVLIGGNTFKWQFIPRDDDIISMLVQLETEFWNGVQANIPPPIDGSEASAKFINERFPNSAPLSKIDLPIKAIPLLQQYDFACAELEKITEQKTEAENLLKQMLGENEAGSIENRLVTWKNITQERLNGKALKAKHPALYKRYITKNSYRRFAINAAN